MAVETTPAAPRFRPAATSTRTFGAVTYHMMSSDTIDHPRARKNHDSVFGATIKRVDGLKVTTHRVFVGVDNFGHAASLLQDENQAYAAELLATAMTGYQGRMSDERF